MTQIGKTRLNIGVARMAYLFRHVFIVIGVVAIVLSVVMFAYEGIDFAPQTLLCGLTEIAFAFALKWCEKKLLQGCGQTQPNGNELSC